MEKQTSTDEIERELRATLAARREVGPNYDDHLIEAFMQKLNQQALVAPAPQPQPPPKNAASSGQRLGLAIVSVVMLIPLAAIAISDSGLAALVVLGLVVLGINIAFNARG